MLRADFVFKMNKENKYNNTNNNNVIILFS